jgi:hypothetical protein
VIAVEMRASVECDPKRLWDAWRPAYPIRPREEESRNVDLYPLAFGLRVPVTLVAVNEMRNWTVQHRLPAGRLVIDHTMSPEGEGRVRIGKRFEVYGPMIVPYRLVFLPGARREWPREVQELTARACG